MPKVQKILSALEVDHVGPSYGLVTDMSFKFTRMQFACGHSHVSCLRLASDRHTRESRKATPTEEDLCAKIQILLDGFGSVKARIGFNTGLGCVDATAYINHTTAHINHTIARINHTTTHINHTTGHINHTKPCMGWLQLVGSLKL